MRAVVTELPLGEPARFNPERLENLCNAMGEARAETEVALALERIAQTLAGIDPTVAGGHLAYLRLSLEDLARDADLIGMSTLARVARDVLACEACGNDTAFRATLARLRRVGERSIHAVWDLDDLSG